MLHDTQYQYDLIIWMFHAIPDILLHILMLLDILAGKREKIQCSIKITTFIQNMWFITGIYPDELLSDNA